MAAAGPGNVLLNVRRTWRSAGHQADSTWGRSHRPIGDVLGTFFC